jgi:hypothetical protein
MQGISQNFDGDTLMKTGFTIAMTIACIACAVWCNLPQKPVLMSVAEQQTVLVERGHDIKVDGKFGPATDLALSIELSKRGE